MKLAGIHSRKALRFATTALCALAYFAATFGVPVLVPERQAANSAVPYPCQGHACGCRSEEQCRRQCCCFTPVQRLAWYRQRGLAAPLAKTDASQVAAQPAKCCTKSHGGVAESSSQRDSGWQLVIASQAQRCGGQATFWLALGAVLPIQNLTVDCVDRSPGEWFGETIPGLVSIDPAPPVPPPRLALA